MRQLDPSRKRRWRPAIAAAGFLAFCVLTKPAWAQSDPLPSWSEGAAKHAITDFVAAVTADGAPDYVPRDERIAVFDNDGTLWPEQPIYVQLTFALDRVRNLAPQHPEWRQQQPFKAVLEGDMKALAAAGEKGAVELVMATHAGMTVPAFAAIVKDWFATAIEPRFRRPPAGRFRQFRRRSRNAAMDQGRPGTPPGGSRASHRWRARIRL